MVYCTPDPSWSHTMPTTKLDVCGFGYNMICLYSRYNKPSVVYRESEVSSKLIEYLRQEEEAIKQILSQVTPTSKRTEEKEASKMPFLVAFARNHSLIMRDMDNLYLTMIT